MRVRPRRPCRRFRFDDEWCEVIVLTESSIVRDEDGNETPRARSTSRVRFNLDANEAHSPEAQRRRRSRNENRNRDENDNGEASRRHHRLQKHKRDSKDPKGDEFMNDKYERPPSGSTYNEDEENSDGTIDMPARFDAKGNKIRETGDGLEGLIGTLASRFLGSGGGDDEEGGRSGRRRHRH